MSVKKSSYTISVIIPSYNEALSLPTTIDNLVSSLIQIKNSTFELVIVNDGSNDNTTEIVHKIIDNKKSNKYSIVYLPFTRNFGKEAAVLAGYSVAKGDILGSIDADGQHPPEDFAKMVNELILHDDYDVVIGVREDQSHKKIGFFSSIFYRLNKWMGNSHLIANGTDFRVMRRYVTEIYLTLQERNRINRDLMDWMGFPYKIYTFKASQRTAGVASYSFKKLVSLAIDGIISAGTKPLSILLPFGGLITIFSLLVGLVLSFNLLADDYFKLNITWQGVALLIIIFFFGIVLSALGILALYISRTFNEVRNRPHYIIHNTRSKKG